MDIAVALIAGGFIGAVLGFVGAGGAMLSVPILMYGFGFDPKPATTAALAVVLLAALSGVIPKARKKQVLYRAFLYNFPKSLLDNKRSQDDHINSYKRRNILLTYNERNRKRSRNSSYGARDQQATKQLFIYILVQKMGQTRNTCRSNLRYVYRCRCDRPRHSHYL